MKKPIWFQTDLGYLKTKDLLVKKYRDQIVGDMEDRKGRLHFHLRSFKDVTFQITTKGKLGIYYPEEVGYAYFLAKVKPLLVKADGTPPEKFIEIKKKETKEEVKPRKKLSGVRKTIETLRFLLMRDPTIDEIAYKMGETPEAIREIVFKLSPKIGWKEPSEKESSNAEQKIREIYEIASLLRHFDINNVLKRPTQYLHKESSDRILERAKYAQKSEPDKLPRIAVTKEDRKWKEFEFTWPRGSRFLPDYPEYYYKETGELSGKGKYLKDIAKRNIEDLKKLRKNFEDLTKT